MTACSRVHRTLIETYNSYNSLVLVFTKTWSRDQINRSMLVQYWKSNISSCKKPQVKYVHCGLLVSFMTVFCLAHYLFTQCWRVLWQLPFWKVKCCRYAIDQRSQLWPHLKWAPLLTYQPLQYHNSSEPSVTEFTPSVHPDVWGVLRVDLSRYGIQNHVGPTLLSNKCIQYLCTGIFVTVPHTQNDQNC